MRKRVVRALIFLIIAVAGALGAVSAAGALDSDVPNSDVPNVTSDAVTWE